MQTSPLRIALGLGGLSFALITGALAFQYVGRYAPCDVCHWQRWPHIASAVIGLGCSALALNGMLDRRWNHMLAAAVIALVAVGGLLGVYHVGIEQHIWGGPEHCSGTGVVFRGLDGLGKDPIVRCDRPALTILGLSLAAYNAVFSLGAAAVGLFLLRTKQ